MPALNPHAQRLLRRTVEPEYLIEVSSADAMRYACNAVELDDALVVHETSRALRDRLLAAGYRVFSTDLSDFVRHGARCEASDPASRRRTGCAGAAA